MASTNGHHPDLGEPLTLEELRSIMTETVMLPGLSVRLGKTVSARIGPITRSEYFATLPATIPGQEAWPESEIATRREEWYRAQSPEARLAWHRGWFESAALVCVAGVLEPQLTLDDARRLGPDVEVLSTAILRLSGILPSVTEEATVEPTAAPAEATTA